MNFSDFLKVIEIVSKLVPFVRQLIEQVEVPGHGVEKKAAVIAAVTGIMENMGLTISEGVKTGVLKVISLLIDIIV
ncbi:MAG: hypothetical protein WC657_05555, partial [Candidatus Paceibacterota bacterium]